ncbi:MAG: GNAT family N-acetyltransferase [Deltaproteobacteria bacterium]|nr:GNAT family N-acetyltransferase [Deltaproteobacteria bacterium]
MTERLTEEILLTGYYPGVIGKIIELHATYYHEHWGFDFTFETQVGSELSDFMKEFDPGRDGFWAAMVNGVFAGAIAIDGRKSSSDGARLRWFIVEPRLQGKGIGSTLITKSIQFCAEAGHRRVYLWTFQGLDAARTLYERNGFRLTEEHNVDQWGTTLLEQRFDLDLVS